MRRRNRLLLSIGIVIAAAIALRAALPWIAESYVNSELTDMGEYHGRVRDVDLALIRGAYTIHGLTISKAGATTDTPFLDLEKMDVSLQWRALLRARLVGELTMAGPVLNLIRAETDRDTQLGTGVNWPAQIREFFPFHLNVVDVRNAVATFRAPGIDVDESLTLRDLRIELRNLTNVTDRERAAFAEIDAEGRVMGNAPLRLSGRFQPNEKTPTFDINMSLEGARLVDVNPWLEQFLNVDAQRGAFSMYTELAAANGRFEGYVKPIMENPEIFDADEAANGPFQKAWEALVEVGTKLFENRATEQVATEIPLSGEIENPDTDLMTAMINLLRNAFVSAFSHSLEGTVGLKDADLDSAKPEITQEKDGDGRSSR